MITEKEFMEIVENHLFIREDGSVYIKDPELAKKYEEFVKEKAKKEEGTKFLDNICPNISCKK